MPGDEDMARRIEKDVPGVVKAAPVYIKMNK
jgi:hypothetical protein